MKDTLLVLKVGSTFDRVAADVGGDFEDWVSEGLGHEMPIRLHVVDPRREPLPCIESLAGVVITGSHDMVTQRLLWSEECARWLRAAVTGCVPILGICYGHQLLADCLGGQVGYHPHGIEIGSIPINLSASASTDPLFAGLPAQFMGQAVHKQTILRLPPDAEILAFNEFEPTLSFRFGPCAWGVQFHPEFTRAAMQGYVDELNETLADDGLAANEIRNQIVETPEAACILSNFGRFVLSLREHQVLTAGGFI